MTTLPWPPEKPSQPLAVLVSGGLDSAVLLGEALRAYPQVQPIYIRGGSVWDEVELAYLQRFLLALARPNLRPLKMLAVPTGDLYGEHWSLTGRDVPDETCPDESVFLPGRNVLLLGKALVWCHLQGIPEIALAPLNMNPFPDATPEFFEALTKTLNLALNGNLAILRPYRELSKADVIRRGHEFPLQETFSCMQPTRGLHCGHCAKCNERKQAFLTAEKLDPTRYAS